MRKFEVFIKISFFNKDINFTEFDKEYIYHSNNNETLKKQEKLELKHQELETE